MLAVAERLRKEMDEVLVQVDLIQAVFGLATVDLAGVDAAHPLRPPVEAIGALARKLSTRSGMGLDGAFLTACALFELGVRDMIEAFLSEVTTRLPTYGHLPQTIRDWHPKGCASVILSLGQSRFQHLTSEVVVRAISSCVSPSARAPYRLLPEAFVAHERNMGPSEVESVLAERLGLEKAWQKLSRQQDLVQHFGGAADSVVEKAAREALKVVIEKRNGIIHRGNRYVTMGHSEVVSHVSFLGVLTASTAKVLDAYAKSL